MLVHLKWVKSLLVSWHTHVETLSDETFSETKMFESSSTAVKEREGVSEWCTVDQFVNSP